MLNSKEKRKGKETLRKPSDIGGQHISYLVWGKATSSPESLPVDSQLHQALSQGNLPEHRLRPSVPRRYSSGAFTVTVKIHQVSVSRTVRRPYFQREAVLSGQRPCAARVSASSVLMGTKRDGPAPQHSSTVCSDFSWTLLFLGSSHREVCQPSSSW